MLVKELIEELKKIPPDTRVLVNGYEGGFQDISECKDMKVCLEIHSAWYYGEHAYCCKDSCGHIKEDVFVLTRSGAR